MRVHFFATLRQAVGQKTVEIDLPEDATVELLLARVFAAYPPLVPLMQDENGAISRYVHIFVNGRGVAHLPTGLGTRLTAEDTIHVFPAIAGGVSRDDS